MRTLGEIVNAANDGQVPSHEECFWALLALDRLKKSAQFLKELAEDPKILVGGQLDREHPLQNELQVDLCDEFGTATEH